MQIFINDLDDELWEIIFKGDFVPTMKKEDKMFLKLISKFSNVKTEQAAKSYRALNILFCGLDSNEFYCMSACKIQQKKFGIS